MNPLIAVRWLTGATGSLAAAACVALYGSHIAPEAHGDPVATPTPPAASQEAALPITTYAPIFPTPTADQPQPWTETDGPLHVDPSPADRNDSDGSNRTPNRVPTRPLPASESLVPDGSGTPPSSSPSNHPSPTSGNPSSTPPSDVAGAQPARPITAGVTDLVNAARAQAGCLPVTDDPELTDYAQQWAQTQAADRAMSHSGGPYAENVAMGYETAADVMQGWMTSPGHRSNIETCAWTRHGIGAVTVDGRTYWTQVFGT